MMPSTVRHCRHGHGRNSGENTVLFAGLQAAGEWGVAKDWIKNGLKRLCGVRLKLYQCTAFVPCFLKCPRCMQVCAESATRMQDVAPSGACFFDHSPLQRTLMTQTLKSRRSTLMASSTPSTA